SERKNRQARDPTAHDATVNWPATLVATSPHQHLSRQDVHSRFDDLFDEAFSGPQPELDLARKRGLKTTILRVRFNVKFDYGELYEVNSSRDVRVVNNLPHGTLG